MSQRGELPKWVDIGLIPAINLIIALFISGLVVVIIGENPFAIVGGVGAVWVRTKTTPGIIQLQAKHPILGKKELIIRAVPAGAQG